MVGDSGHKAGLTSAQDRKRPGRSRRIRPGCPGTATWVAFYAEPKQPQTPSKGGRMVILPSADARFFNSKMLENVRGCQVYFGGDNAEVQDRQRQVRLHRAASQLGHTKHPCVRSASHSINWGLLPQSGCHGRIEWRGALPFSFQSWRPDSTFLTAEVPHLGGQGLAPTLLRATGRASSITRQSALP